MKLMYTLFVFLLLLTSCGKVPEPINYGKDLCAHCNMKIMDNKFGAVAVNDKGKSFKFDAAECLINYLKENEGGWHSYVTDFDNPPALINSEEAFYLVSEKLRSPMGENLSCYKNRSGAESSMNKFGGIIYNWEGIKKKLQN